MRIAISTNFIYPDSLGGTELYSYQLGGALRDNGHEVFWVVPNFNKDHTSEETLINGVRVVRFAAVESGKNPDPVFVRNSYLQEIVNRKIEVVHFNDFGGFEGINSDLLKYTKLAGLKNIVTLHIPHYTCFTGTLRYGGLKVCDGRIIPSRCAACSKFSNYSKSKEINYLITEASRRAIKLFEKPGLLPGNFKRFLETFRNKQKFVADLSEHADSIVSLTQWFKKILMINGMPVQKIGYISQATPPADTSAITSPSERKGYVFIGRINQEKGIELLPEVAKLVAGRKDIFIDLYGPVYPGNRFAKDFLKTITKFTNITYKGVLTPDMVMPVMSGYKAIILPSLFTEMAPLIIMEANKLTVPVIASDVPGSAELVKQYDCGLIFKYRDVNDLVHKILTIEKNETSFEFRQPLENDFTHIARKYVEIYQRSYPVNVIIS